MLTSSTAQSKSLKLMGKSNITSDSSEVIFLCNHSVRIAMLFNPSLRAPGNPHFIVILRERKNLLDTSSLRSSV